MGNNLPSRTIYVRRLMHGSSESKNADTKHIYESTSVPKMVTVDDLLVTDDNNIIYRVANKIKVSDYPLIKSTHSKGMTYLMKLVLLTKENPRFLEEIETHVTNNPMSLEETNHKGWTPLMIAAANTNTVSSVETVAKLIELGANYNANKTMFKKHRLSPLMVAVAYAGTTSNFETVKLFCEQPKLKKHEKYYQKNAMDYTHLYVVGFAVFTVNPSVEVINYLIEKGFYCGNVEDKILALQNAYNIRISRDKSIVAS